MADGGQSCRGPCRRPGGDGGRAGGTAPIRAGTGRRAGLDGALSRCLGSGEKELLEHLRPTHRPRQTRRVPDAPPPPLCPAGASCVHLRCPFGETRGGRRTCFLNGPLFII